MLTEDNNIFASNLQYRNELARQYKTITYQVGNETYTSSLYDFFIEHDNESIDDDKLGFIDYLDDERHRDVEDDQLIKEYYSDFINYFNKYADKELECKVISLNS